MIRGMNTKTNIIRDYLKAISVVEEILRPQLSKHVTDQDVRKIAGQIFLQLLVIDHLVDLGVIKDECLIKDIKANECSILEDKNLHLSRYLLALLDNNTSPIVDGNKENNMINHPLVVMSHEVIDQFLKLPNNVFFRNLNKKQRNKGEDRDIFTVINELKKSGTEISGEIISNLGEQILFQDERKKKGVFYTPKQLTDHMSNIAIKQYLLKRVKGQFTDVNEDDLDAFIQNAQKDHLLYLLSALTNLKILDIAMGSGHFLASCAQVLLQVHRKLLKRIESIGVKKNLKNAFKNRCCNVVIPTEFRRHIFIHVLYGVDISEWAVRLARARLFLLWLTQSLKKKEKEKLEELETELFNNLKVGNSLLGFTTISEVEKLTKKNEYFNVFKNQPSRMPNQKTNPQIKKKTLDILYWDYLSKSRNTEDQEKLSLNLFHWFKEFPSVFKNINNLVDLENNHDDEGFDIIISNPPFLSIKSSKTPKDAIKPAILRRLYGNVQDIYECFVQRADQLLSPKGIGCLIVPNNIIHAMPTEFEQKIIFFENLGERVFPDAHVIPVAIITWQGKNRPISEQMLLKNLINLPRKLDNLEKKTSLPIPSLRWLKKHPIITKIQSNCFTLSEMGAKITRGEEIGKKSLVKKRQSSSNIIPVFTAMNMRFYGLNEATHFLDPSMIKKDFYSHLKIGFSISFRNRIKCCYVGSNVTLKSIINVYQLDENLIWWALLFYNSTLFDFYHRCLISWYQEKRTNTIQKIREYPLLPLSAASECKGLLNLSRILSIIHLPHLHHLVDLSILELYVGDLLHHRIYKDKDMVVTNYLNEVFSTINIPPQLLTSYPPPFTSINDATILSKFKEHILHVQRNLWQSRLPQVIQNRVRFLEKQERKLLHLKL